MVRKPTLLLDQITGDALIFSHTNIHPILLLVFINCNFADDSDLTAGLVSTEGIIHELVYVLYGSFFEGINGQLDLGITTCFMFQMFLTALQYAPCHICYRKIRSLFMLVVIISSLGSTWGTAMEILKSVKLLTTLQQLT